MRAGAVVQPKHFFFLRQESTDFTYKSSALYPLGKNMHDGMLSMGCILQEFSFSLLALPMYIFQPDNSSSQSRMGVYSIGLSSLAHTPSVSGVAGLDIKGEIWLVNSSKSSKKKMAADHAQNCEDETCCCHTYLPLRHSHHYQSL